ncbi:MAG: hypothetical protein KatS3mg131_2869 [Candidatus Tectimicrobiota bacterium]|nr:MAG: hypothetical protein KatS3mg131_2869 [Candidatus Tectomicrobia bacterium]
MLVLCLGRATKYARYFEALDKTYWAVMRLGMRTDTQDATGSVIEQRPVPPLSRAQLEAVLARFQGTIAQTPPMYSAVKYHGQRLYRLARRGQTVPRPPRQVTIKRLQLLDVRGEWLTLGVTCSKGTYIRTLCEDIGLALGCGAHLVHLQRCRVGPFRLCDAYPLDFLHRHAARERLCLPLSQALAFLPALTLTPQQLAVLRTRQGRDLEAMVRHARVPPQAPGLRLCVGCQETVAVAYRTAPERWKLQYLEA